MRIILYYIFTVKVHVAFTFPSWQHCHMTFSRVIILWSLRKYLLQKKKKEENNIL